MAEKIAVNWKYNTKVYLDFLSKYKCFAFLVVLQELNGVFVNKLFFHLMDGI